MKKKKNTAKKVKSRKKKISKKSLRPWAFLYVIFQLILIPTLFITVNRCSPLSPSTTVADLNSGKKTNLPLVFKDSSQTQASYAVSAEELAASATTVSNKTIFYMVGQAAEYSDPTAFTIRLSDDEKNLFLQGNAVALRIAPYLKNLRKTNTAIQAALQSMKKPGSENEHNVQQIRLHIFYLNSQPKKRLYQSALNSSFAISSIDGMVLLKIDNESLGKDMMDAYNANAIGSIVVEIL